MKQFLLLTAVVVAAFSLNAQVIISGFTFPTDQGEEPFNANLGLDKNKTYDIRMEDMDGNDYTLTLTEGAAGAGDFAATAQNWEDGANTKMLSIKIKAADYGTFAISSKMYSDATNPGPKDWKIMWRLSGGEWTDLEGGAFSIGNDWTTGEVTALNIPETANNPESSLYIAWVPTTNLDINGNPVAANGTVKIDEIFVNGYENNSVESLVYENSTNVYPNPAQTTCTISAEKNATSIEIFDMAGRVVYNIETPKTENNISVSDLNNGLYMVRVSYANMVINRKLIVK